MKRIWIAFAAFVALAAAALIYWLNPQPILPRSSLSLPRLPLRDGGEFHVLQITYTAQPSQSTDHNIGASKTRWWLYRHIPTALRQRIPPPSYGIGDLASTRPVLSIWWTHIHPATHKPELGEAGDVLMTDDQGRLTNLGWPSPAEDYRQIFVIDPPTNSKQLTFEFPIWGERVRFSIDNPAYKK